MSSSSFYNHNFVCLFWFKQFMVNTEFSLHICHMYQSLKLSHFVLTYTNMHTYTHIYTWICIIIYIYTWITYVYRCRIFLHFCKLLFKWIPVCLWCSHMFKTHAVSHSWLLSLSLSWSETHTTSIFIPYTMTLTVGRIKMCYVILRSFIIHPIRCHYTEV